VVNEAVAKEYDLPNSTAYNETCAQIGNFMWNWRMLMINGEARHADMMEQALYGSILSGIGLDGASWFYTNPLRWYGKEHKLLTHDSHQRFQPGEPPERRCICCPSNLVRTIAGLHGYLYTLDDSGICIDHYAASTFDGQLLNHEHARLVQKTDYPWDGRIKLTFEHPPKTAAAVKLRIPGWADGATVKVNGRAVETDAKPCSYISISRIWGAGDAIELDLPMRVRLLEANHKVEQCLNQLAVTRGPVLYCLESPDLPADVRVHQVALQVDAKLTAKHRPDLLSGVTILEGDALLRPVADGGLSLYREVSHKPAKPIPVRLIPYYAWANRGESEMTVWMPRG